MLVIPYILDYYCRIYVSSAFCFCSLTLFHLYFAPEMSVRMSNLDNERDERDEDSHEDRGISKCYLNI